MDTQQLVNGKLGHVKDICLVHAQRTFRERGRNDTKPTIVQMINMGQLIPHWYYRSDDWIDQPYCKLSEFVQPYVGPTNQAPPWYGSGSYRIDRDMTNMCKRELGL